jgi:hypothetical protein
MPDGVGVLPAILPAGTIRAKQYRGRFTLHMSENPYQSPENCMPARSYHAAPAFTATTFSIDCECGATIPVVASEAGATLTCRCSRVVQVPRLSRLRAAKGLAAHDTNIRDTIARMIAENHLPGGPCCAVSAMPTEDVMWFDIHCESTYTKATNRWGMAMAMLAFVILVFISWPLAILTRLMRADTSNETERLGREIVISVPLRVRQDSQSKLKGWASQQYLRKILSSVPEYQELFREHPKAMIYPQ